MKITYRLVSELFLLISPLIILYRVLKGKENLYRSLERYAISSEKRNQGKLIWFHCSSVGEFLSLVPIIEKLQINPKVQQILITTTTLSSSKIYNKLKLKKTIHQFFPIDNKFIVKKFINYWKPSVFFLCESEIWPNMINEVYERKIKLVLINGRMSLNSYKKWKKIKHYSKDIFGMFDLCLVQNTETYKRLNYLGAKKILNKGNLKFTTSKKVKADLLEKKLINFFDKKKVLITAASTHFNEEEFIIKNHLIFKNKKKANNVISIIVPRHVERTAQIKEDIEKFSLKVHLHSSKKNLDKNTDIYIVDTYGELNKFYRISNLVFMGGSLINHGGQNPLEAAKFGCKIINGPNISNFKEIYNKLKLMKISIMFKNYNQGIKIIENSLDNNRLVSENKKLMDYGKKILKLNYLEIIRFI